MARENGIDEIEVHVAGICFDEQDGKLRVLIGKRADDRKIYPGLWECGGGQVRRNQTFQDAVKTQMRDEFGIEVDVLFPLGDYSIETEGKVIPGMRFVCSPRSGQKVYIDRREIVDFRWITLLQMRDFQMIPSLSTDITQAAVMLRGPRAAESTPEK